MPVNDKMKMASVWARRDSDQTQIGQYDQPHGEPWNRGCLWRGPALGRNGQALIPHCVQLLAQGCLGWGSAGAGDS